MTRLLALYTAPPFCRPPSRSPNASVSPPCPNPSGDDLALVHLDSLNHRSVGAERLVLHALDALQLANTLQTLGASSRDARIASGLVLARMLHLSSEREAHASLSRRSAALDLLGFGTSSPDRTEELIRDLQRLQETHLSPRGKHFAVRSRTQGVVAQLVPCVAARLPPMIR